MLFSSTIFLFLFLPIVFGVYYVLAFSRLAQNIWLMLVSILFYAWGEPINILLMLAVVLLNWTAGWLIEKNNNRLKTRRFIMISSCVINLTILFIFKYLGFFVNVVNEGAGHPLLPEVVLALPIGISFFTFQAMSYVLDVYKHSTKAEKNPFYVGLYIAFFPQLIAGPIVRYASIAEQLHTRKSNINKISMGACRFVVGLGKKILLANNFAILADTIFNYSAMGQEMYNVPIMLAWLGAIAYTLQIYFDFSGYSDMAIGLGLMFGFKFDENFNYPYAATSLLDFWRKWHISLTSWFREYVYFPLGGSRVKNKDIMIRNLFIVWLLTGIWHGANWTFLFWGLWHFCFQLAERFFGYGKDNKHPILMHAYTMLVVTLGWVMFRAQDLYQAGRYFLNMFGLSNNGFFSKQALFLMKEYGVFLILGIVFCAPVARRINEWLVKSKQGIVNRIITTAYPFAIVALFYICVSYLARGGYNPFIYFNF
ncbi:MAG: MBOAT family protein [Lachnospiraceae bacterium]